MPVAQTQLERAIHEIQNRVAVPELDFTQHQLENGYTVSTQERAVKEVCAPLAFPITCADVMGTIAAGASTRDDNSDERPVLLEDGQDQARCRVPEKPLLSRGPLKGGARLVYHRKGDAAPPRRAQRLERRSPSDRCHKHSFFTLTTVSNDHLVCGDIHGQYVRISPLHPPRSSTHMRRDGSMTL